MFVCFVFGSLVIDSIYNTLLRVACLAYFYSCLWKEKKLLRDHGIHIEREQMCSAKGNPCTGSFGVGWFK